MQNETLFLAKRTFLCSRKSTSDTDCLFDKNVFCHRHFEVCVAGWTEISIIVKITPTYYSPPSQEKCCATSIFLFIAVHMSELILLYVTYCFGPSSIWFELRILEVFWIFSWSVVFDSSHQLKIPNLFLTIQLKTYF